ncbi:MAG: hypothetical protein M3186_09995 [Actinomycetota bacterium]|nr:hypothetical protein [Actinomycetota bacterium]
MSILQRRVRGVYNLAANELNLTQLAGLVGARPLPVPGAILRAVVTALFRAHVLAVSPGWLDVATRTPVMDTARARTVLGWQPAHSSEQPPGSCSTRGLKQRLAPLPRCATDHCVLSGGGPGKSPALD